MANCGETNSYGDESVVAKGIENPILSSVKPGSIQHDLMNAFVSPQIMNSVWVAYSYNSNEVIEAVFKDELEARRYAMTEMSDYGKVKEVALGERIDWRPKTNQSSN